MKLGSPIWHCKRNITADDSIMQYNSPTKIITALKYCTVQPASLNTNKDSYYTTQEYGEKTTNAWTMLCDANKFKNRFTEGDLLYIEGATPPSSGANGTGANAIISRVAEQNRCLYISLYKIEGA